ncbi:uncharacterized protein FFM5_00611 [Fusarium fujikuroi]|nr:uncharacterized protein FFM5_00611 [Fusarium fujikuroi]
MADLRACF